MSRNYIIVPAADRGRVRAALLRELGAVLGRPVATGGYTGMAGRLDATTFAPPGLGETLQTCEERVSRDGTEVAFLLDDVDGAEIVLRDPFERGRALRMRSLAGARVHGEQLPVVRVVDETTYFPDPPPTERP